MRADWEAEQPIKVSEVKNRRKGANNSGKGGEDNPTKKPRRSEDEAKKLKKRFNYYAPTWNPEDRTMGDAILKLPEPEQLKIEKEILALPPNTGGYMGKVIKIWKQALASKDCAWMKK
jgi:hypothetical protein